MGSKFEMITVDTNHPIAYQSDDYMYPWGTRTSNANDGYFRAKLLRLFDEKIDWSLLDLGCSGGALVESFHEIGIAAVGIEGSDYSFNNSRGSWPKLGFKRLFTADICKPFTINLHGAQMVFDVITAWDVLEHLQDYEIPGALKNINNHLRDDGICMFSIATIGDNVQGVELHKTIMSRNEWEKTFKANGFEVFHEVENYLSGHSARGRRNDERSGFNIVLKKIGISARVCVPNTGVFEKIADKFIGSKIQKKIKSLVVGDSL